MSIIDAVETRPGTDPDRASFTIALEHARNQLIKAPTSRYSSRHPDDNRPATSTRIATSTYLIHPRLSTPPQRTAYRRVKGLGDEPTSFREHLVALFATQPARHWRTRDIAQLLPFPSYETCRAQLAHWARQGAIRRISPGIYTLPEPTQALTTTAST